MCGLMDNASSWCTNNHISLARWAGPAVDDIAKKTMEMKKVAKPSCRLLFLCHELMMSVLMDASSWNTNNHIFSCQMSRPHRWWHWGASTYCATHSHNTQHGSGNWVVQGQNWWACSNPFCDCGIVCTMVSSNNLFGPVFECLNKQQQRQYIVVQLLLIYCFGTN